MNISDRISELKRRFKHRTSYSFIYNKPADLKKVSNKIMCYYLLRDAEIGSWLYNHIWYEHDMNIQQWRHFLEYDSTKILVEKVLPHRNANYSTNWEFHSLIAWSWVLEKYDYRKKVYKK